MNTLLILLEQPASSGSGSEGGAGIMGWLPMLLIFVIFIVFFMIIPSRRKAKEQKQFRESLKKGDKVVTIGGFHGKITEVKENTVMVSIAPEVIVELEMSALVQNASQVGQG